MIARVAQLCVARGSVRRDVCSGRAMPATTAMAATLREVEGMSVSGGGPTYTPSSWSEMKRRQEERRKIYIQATMAELRTTRMETDGRRLDMCEAEEKELSVMRHHLLWGSLRARL